MEMGATVLNQNTGDFLHDIAIENIQPNPFQPRKVINDSEIKELSASISEKGLLQPILVRKHQLKYQIIAGERRFLACKSLGQKSIRAQVREKVSDRDMMELSLIENIQRVQLSAIEESQAYEQLINKCGLTHQELSDKLGKSRPSITNSLRLLKLHPQVQELIRHKKLSSGHARALLQHPLDKQLIIAEKIINEEINVRGAESIKPRKTPPTPPSLDPNLASFLDKIRLDLGTKVTIKGTETKGVLQISYASQPELEHISEIIRAGYNKIKD